MYLDVQEQEQVGWDLGNLASVQGHDHLFQAVNKKKKKLFARQGIGAPSILQGDCKKNENFFGSLLSVKPGRRMFARWTRCWPRSRRRSTCGFLFFPFSGWSPRSTSWRPKLRSTRLGLRRGSFAPWPHSPAEQQCRTIVLRLTSLYFWFIKWSRHLSGRSTQEKYKSWMVKVTTKDQHRHISWHYCLKMISLLICKRFPFTNSCNWIKAWTKMS